MLPQPSILSVPLAVFRVAMLLWSLWLAWMVIFRWSGWVWDCFSGGGVLRKPGLPEWLGFLTRRTKSDNSTKGDEA